MVHALHITYLAEIDAKQHLGKLDHSRLHSCWGEGGSCPSVLPPKIVINCNYGVCLANEYIALNFTCGTEPVACYFRGGLYLQYVLHG